MTDIGWLAAIENSQCL